MDVNGHLAELNIGRIRYPLDDPRMAEFVDNLALVNGIADRSPGFVWRLQDTGADATGIRPFDDPQIIVNVSVWEHVEALERYVWQTVHKRFYGRRHEWFDRFEGPYFVMWWVPVGHRPTIQEGSGTDRPAMLSVGRASRRRKCGRRRGARNGSGRELT